MIVVFPLSQFIISTYLWYVLKGILQEFLLYISESFSEEEVIKPNQNLTWENNMQDIQGKAGKFLTISDVNTGEQTKDIGKIKIESSKKEFVTENLGYKETESTKC